MWEEGGRCVGGGWEEGGRRVGGGEWDGYMKLTVLPLPTSVLDCFVSHDLSAYGHTLLHGHTLNYHNG